MLSLRAKRLSVVLIFSIFLVTAGVSLTKVSGAATCSIDPASGMIVINTPVVFSISGANASAAYNYNVDSSGIASFTTGSDGTAQFTYSFTTTGNHLVQIRMGSTLGAGSIVATSNLLGDDPVADLMPWMVLLIALIIIFGVFGMVSDRLGINTGKH